MKEVVVAFKLEKTSMLSLCLTIDNFSPVMSFLSLFLWCIDLFAVAFTPCRPWIVYNKLFNYRKILISIAPHWKFSELHTLGKLLQYLDEVQILVQKKILPNFQGFEI